MSLPHLISGIVLLLLFSWSGLGEWLSAQGIEVVFHPNGIVLAQVFINLPYMIKMMKTVFDSISTKLEFVARTLGFTYFGAFVSVTLPLCKRGLFSTVVIIWSRALGEFGAVLMLAGATRFKTETLPMAVFLNISTGNLEAAVATATLLILISLTTQFIFEKIDDRCYGF